MLRPVLLAGAAACVLAACEVPPAAPARPLEVEALRQAVTDCRGADCTALGAAYCAAPADGSSACDLKGSGSTATICCACTNPTQGCGSDCGVCAARPNAVASCANNTAPAATACVYTCQPGYADVDGDPATGCEARCDTAARCGTDCQACAITNASAASCSGNGSPAAQACVPACLGGYTDRDGHGENGCESCDVAAACGSDCAACAAAGASATSCTGNAAPAATACTPTCEPGFADHDGDGADGCESCAVPAACGSDCAACATTGAAATACAGNAAPAATACTPTCSEGFQDQDSDGANGCEACTGLPACGSDCRACLSTGATATSCADHLTPAASACQPVCAAGHKALDPDGANGCEACNRVSDCGLECLPCQTTGAVSTACSGNTASIASACVPACSPGFKDRDGHGENGCESCDVAAACGSDCVACGTLHATTASCANNAQAATLACVPSCETGYRNQDGDGVNGCEACSSSTACGSDCQTCQLANATSTSCLGNSQEARLACRPICQAGWADADGNGANGCEARCDTAARCGNDCLACATTNASAASCSGNGSPAAQACVPACLGGYQDRDGHGENGCEGCTVNGACGSDCLDCKLTNATSTSCAGRAQPAALSCTPTCASGWASADGNGQNGCEAACLSEARCGSDCQPCQANNASSTGCTSNTLLASAACNPVCSSGFKNLDSNAANGCESCSGNGACGTDCKPCQLANATATSCAGNAAPAAQACTPTCSPGYRDLDNDRSNGCETTCLTLSHCGSDCQACQAINASSTSCTSNTQPAAVACNPACLTGFKDQDATAANGCELCGTAAACGSDCRACQLTNASGTSCLGNSLAAAQSCRPQCQPGFFDLDGDGANGCEATCNQPERCGTDCGACQAANTASVSCAGNTQLAQLACRPTCLSGWANLDGNQQNGCEAKCDQAGRCGTNCLPCQTSNTTANTCSGNAVAAAQACQPTCQAGYANVDNDGSNGCEATCSSAQRCGSDCGACQATNASTVSCAGNTSLARDACRPTCLPGFADLDGNRQNGCEARCDQVDRCGTNCLPCQLGHASASACSGNTATAGLACQPTCLPGFANADGDGSNGCEATCNSAARCGSDCGACASLNAASVGCAGNTELARDACRPVCREGYLDLDASRQNGCEATCNQITRCGTDCAPCQANHTASTACSGNTTAAVAACLPICAAGYANLDSDGANGCETTCDSTAHCGSDCKACGAANASATSCAGNSALGAQSCQPTCNPGFQNLDGSGLNGCEASCAVAAHCGSDCQPCQTTNATSTSCANNTALAAAACQPVCKPGYADLDGDRSNGCEAACVTAAACGSNCVACQEINTSATACANNTELAGQACRPTCLPGFQNLDGNNRNGCEAACDQPGRCGTDCKVCQAANASATICENNTEAAALACKPTCKPGFADVDGNAQNGCETACTSTARCGTNCLACGTENATATSCANNTALAAAACKPVCADGHRDVDGNGANGCEAPCSTPGRCGSDCKACQLTNASEATCAGNAAPAAQACQPSCSAGFATVDGDGQNGCEARCDQAGRCGTDCRPCEAAHALGNACGGHLKPAAEACAPTCEAGWANADADGANGCEAACDAPTRCGQECAACDRTNAAGVTCTSNATAAASACTPACQPGYVNDDGDGLNGCEGRCDQPERCGASCQACPAHPHSTVACTGADLPTAQACVYTCAAGYVDADPFADGCESECTRPEHCGSDCRPCTPAAHAVASCSGRELPAAESCGQTCEVGYADLNADAADGCEACSAGYYNRSATSPADCERCDVDEHCGYEGAALCLDCGAEREGGRCLFGRCGCHLDEDCPAGQGLSCRDHTCVKDCEDAADCDDDQRCCGPSGAKVCVQWGDEVCDGRDNDCDGVVDDLDQEAPLCAQQQGVCAGARSACAEGLIEPCDGAVYAAFSADFEATETRCDGKDNDCNGQTDEAAACTVPDAGPPVLLDGGSAFTGQTFDLGGCGCQQAAAPGALGLLGLALAALAGRRRRR